MPTECTTTSFRNGWQVLIKRIQLESSILLAKENKKFQYSVLRKGGRSSQYIGSIQWLEDAGIAKRCYNTQITELPLEGNSINDCFKL